MLFKHVLLLLILSVLSSMTLTVAGLLYVEHVNMTDSVYTSYGFPYWWLIHVGVTLAGPTDTWWFEKSNLVKDMILFFLLTLGFWFLILLSKEKMTQTPKRKVVSGMMLGLLLLNMLTVAFNIQPVEAQTRAVGVKIGDWAKYEVAYNYTTNDPLPLSGFPPDFSYLEYFKIEVLSVTGTNITFQATRYFKNGTEMSNATWTDISSNLVAPLPFFTLAILFIAANLTVGDRLLPNPMSPLVNVTVMRTYAGAEREVNFVNRSSTHSIIRVSPPKEEYIDDSTTCMFCDRATGVLVEANDTAMHHRIELGLNNHPLPGGYVYVTEIFTRMAMKETNIWSHDINPQFLPFWLQWWFYVAVAVVVVSLGGVIYLLKKRKPRVITPLPLEGADKISSTSN